jgi:hypothetical protein
MKTFQLTILKENDEVLRVLNELVAKQLIEFRETTESELGPYYSEEDAKDILNL